MCMASGRAHHDVAALLSCWRFATGLPGAVRYGWQMLPVLMAAYDREVAPVVAVVVNPAARVSVDRALRAMSIKIGLSMVNFAQLAGCALRVDIAVLAGAVTRLQEVAEILVDRHSCRRCAPGSASARVITYPPTKTLTTTSQSQRARDPAMAIHAPLIAIAAVTR